ncbi:MAG: PKD domain-containing protein [Candidatus Poseidoniia archaeon]|nr:PKD domain-containing protein [Candidatus Poseidoniia archaeon]
MDTHSVRLPLAVLLLLAVVALSVSEGAEAIDPEWNYTTGEGVRSAAISADGEYIVAGSDDENVYLFKKDSSTPLWSYSTGNTVRSVAISADGEYIAAGSNEYVHLFDKDSSTPLWSYSTESDAQSISISADGEYIAFSTGDSKVYLFDKDSDDPLWIYTIEGSSAYSVAISADGEYIVSGSWDGEIDLFHRSSSTPQWNYTAEDEHVVRSVSISADGEYVTAISDDYNIYLFDKDSNQPLWSYRVGNQGCSVSISADGEYIAAVTYDGNGLYLFNSDNSTPLWNHTIAGNVYSAAISADGEYIVVSGGNNVFFFDKDSSTPLWSYTTGNEVHTVAISADGAYIVAGSFDSKVYAFKNTASGNDPPQIWSIDVGPNPAYENERVYFDSDSEDADGEIVAFEWTSDVDGLLSTSDSFDSDGLSVGIHTISFRVQDDDGAWSDYAYHDLEIEGVNDPPQIWSIDVGPNPAYENVRVYFDSDSEDTDGEIVAFEWTSDVDGLLSTKNSFDSDGLSVGAHTISFRVQDNDGAWSDYAYQDLMIESEPTNISDERKKQVDITPGKPVTLSAWENLGLQLELAVGKFASGNVTVTSVNVTPPLPDNGTLKDVGIFVSISMDVIVQDSLDYAKVTLNFDIKLLPDGVIADTLQVYHYSDEGGWEASETGGIDLENGTVWGHFTNFSVFAVFGSNAAPVADAGPDLKITPGSQAMFFGTAVDADGTIALYEWDFDGDGVFDYSASDGVASHVYDDEGSYLAILRVTDNNGATGFDETLVTVAESSSLAFLDNPLFRIFFPTAILLLAVGYYAYRKYATSGAGAFGAQKRNFALKKEEDVTVVCPACGIHMKVPRLGTLQMVVCDNCGNEGEMEV